MAAIIETQWRENLESGGTLMSAIVQPDLPVIHVFAFGHGTTITELRLDVRRVTNLQGRLLLQLGKLHLRGRAELGTARLPVPQQDGGRDYQRGDRRGPKPRMKPPLTRDG